MCVWRCGVGAVRVCSPRDLWGASGNSSFPSFLCLATQHRGLHGDLAAGFPPALACCHSLLCWSFYLGSDA